MSMAAHVQGRRRRATVWLRTLGRTGGTLVGAEHSLLTSEQPWHTSGTLRMRNYITPDHCALSTPSTEARHVSSVANSNQRLELVKDDRNSNVTDARSNLATKVAPHSIDFEGFGSFSG
jgi:hypothetical protein